MTTNQRSTAREAAGLDREDVVMLRPRMRRQQVLVFVLTFFAYVSFHSARKGYSNAKNNLHDQWHFSSEFMGTLDTLFLFFYAVGLYISGYLGDSFDVRKVLVGGMGGTCVAVALFGLAHVMGVRTKLLFAALWCVNGLLQSTGWPCTVHVMGNWFSKTSGGRVFGVWSANASFGNIVGSLMVSLCVHLKLGIPFMFLLPAGFILFMAFLCYNYMHVRPSEAGLPVPEVFDDEGNVLGSAAAVDDDGDIERTMIVETNDPIAANAIGNKARVHIVASGDEADEDDEDDDAALDDVVGDRTDSSGKTALIHRHRGRSSSSAHGGGGHGAAHGGEGEGIGFLAAIQIPGVIAYSLSYACLKMVNYSLFFWLPFYLHTGLHFSDGHSDLTSNLYDVGQIFGGIVAGYVSDRMGVRSPVTVAMLLISVGGLYLYQIAKTMLHVSALMAFTGFMIGGPANMISSTISADLGKHESIKGDAKALSTVTGIIDGTGSIGAALGQYGVAYMSHHVSWKAVFFLLMGMTLLSALCLTQLFLKDMAIMRARRAGTFTPILYGSFEGGPQASPFPPQHDGAASTSAVGGPYTALHDDGVGGSNGPRRQQHRSVAQYDISDPHNNKRRNKAQTRERMPEFSPHNDY